MIFLLQFKQILKGFYYVIRKIFILILFWPFYLLKKIQVPSDPASVLVISQRRLGDAVLSLPIFHAIRETFPGCVIAVLTNPYLREVFELSPEVDRVIEYTQNRRRISFLEIFRLIMEIRKQRFHLIIDLNTDGCLDFALVAGFSGAEHSIGYGQDGRGVFFDTTLHSPAKGSHMIDLVLNTLDPWKAMPSNRRVHLQVPDLERDEIRRRLAQAGVKEGTPLVGMHPGGVHLTQRWPVEYFAELADGVILAGLGRVILCGGAGDQDRINQVAGNMKEKAVLLPPLSALKQFAALLSEFDLVVCNNSGPLHLATAVGTPTISFMGPTAASQWWPAGDRNTVFRKDDLACIGCNLGYCRIKTHDCMRGILPEKVLEAVRSQLDRNKYVLEASRN